MNAVAGGWGVSVIVELRSGPPWGAIEQTNLSNTFSSSQRPNLLSDPNISGDRSRADMLLRYFDTSAFQAPGIGIFGNAPREPGFSPGYVVMDASLHKRWTIRERIGLHIPRRLLQSAQPPQLRQPRRGSRARGLRPHRRHRSRHQRPADSTGDAAGVLSSGEVDRRRGDTPMSRV